MSLEARAGSADPPPQPSTDTESPRDRPREQWVDAAKAVSITLVVLFHVMSWLEVAGVSRDPLVLRVLQTTGGMRLPLFFLASGLFATRWVQKPSWRAFANGKLALLVWVYLVWQLSAFAYRYSGAVILTDEKDGALEDQLIRVLMSPVRANSELWFLWALALFFVLARLLRRWPSWLVVLAAAAVSVFWSTVVLPAGVHVRMGEAGKAGMYFVFFMVGQRYSNPIRDLAARIRWWQAAFVVAAWILTLGVLQAGLTLPAHIFYEQLFGVTAGICLAVLLARVRVVTFLGRHTLPVYVSHMTFIHVIVLTLYFTGGPDHLSLAALPWLLTPAAVLLGLALHRYAASTVLFNPPAWFAVGEPSRRQGS